MGPFLGFGAVREVFGERGSLWAELVLGTPVVLWSGLPFLARGWTSFRTMHLNMFSLIAMGVTAAWLYSVVAVVAHRASSRPDFAMRRAMSGSTSRLPR